MARRGSPVSLWALLVAAIPAAAAAQQAAPVASSGSATAVTYEARRTTKVNLVGTPLMPRARGEAEIKTEDAGPVRIKAKVRDALVPPLGPEYLSLVLWAVPPQGRAKNLGELRLDDGSAEIEVTSDVQTFALIVTVEPYYAVTMPSDTIVMENAVRQDTRGRTSIAPLQYEIVPRGAYVANAGVRVALPRSADREPPDVQQARNAFAIALIADADRYAPQSMSTARRLLGEVERLIAGRGSQRDIVSQARASVQAAEEARLQSVERRAAEAQESARIGSAQREQAALDAAAREAAARRTAEEERERADQAAREAVLEQAKAEQARREAARQQEQAEEARQEAEAARQEAEKARAEAETQADRAGALRAHAEEQQIALRATILKQFGAILETRDTARGLIVNVGDVLFETGRYELRPPAREKLARFAGIVLAHAGLVVQVEGFTDSTGTPDLNQQLSERRAGAVAGFLMEQGLSRDRLSTRGYGPSDPVASNDTSEGRRQNRRVELVVSGEIIGTPIAHERR